MTVVKLNPSKGSIKEPGPEQMEDTVTLWAVGGGGLARLVEDQAGQHGGVGLGLGG